MGIAQAKNAQYPIHIIICALKSLKLLKYINGLEDIK